MGSFFLSLLFSSKQCGSGTKKTKKRAGKNGDKHQILPARLT